MFRLKELSLPWNGDTRTPHPPWVPRIRTLFQGILCRSLTVSLSHSRSLSLPRVLAHTLGLPREVANTESKEVKHPHMDDQSGE